MSSGVRECYSLEVKGKKFEALFSVGLDSFYVVMGRRREIYCLNPVAVGWLPISICIRGKFLPSGKHSESQQIRLHVIYIMMPQVTA